MGVRRKPRTKLPKLTTSEMEVAIAKYFGYRTHIVVPNVSWGFTSHECDLLLIRKSGYCFEVEIKRSKTDMLADFKKRHKHIDRQNRIVQLYYAFPKELLSNVEELVPKECGILTVERYVGWNDKWSTSVSMVRDAKRKRGARKLTQKEQLQVARLGTLRIWTLKDKINQMKQKK